MGEKTGIAWTDMTFNPWIGCQKVSAGCQNCYAARENNRYKWVNEWGKDYRRTSEANWKKPIQWAKDAARAGIIRRVFCASLADVYDDNPIVEEWRLDLFDLINQTREIGGLEWLILTKRPENLYPFTPSNWRINPPDNVRMGVTAENQETADYRIPDLLNTWKGKNFVSWEPALEYVNFWRWLPDSPTATIDWVICGSESGQNARTFETGWARAVRDQCVAANIPFFLKQMPVDGKLTILPKLDGKVWGQFP